MPLEINATRDAIQLAAQVEARIINLTLVFCMFGARRKLLHTLRITYCLHQPLDLAIQLKMRGGSTDEQCLNRSSQLRGQARSFVTTSAAMIILAALT